jgi:NitT/TauT family transport system ATP-binding protein
MGTHATIRLEAVTKRFPLGPDGGLTAVQEVSLEVHGGEFVSVVGPSGCGKSTLLGMISGLLPNSGGRILVEGEVVAGINRKLGYLFQRDALLPWKTVLDNVSLPLLFRRYPPQEARARARDWLQRVGLSGFETYYPHQLSGGMRKRVSLAMTMVYEPAIILMDEPFAALDVQTRNLMENDLLEIWAQERKTVLFITHDLEEAIALSDRVIVMTASPGRVKGSYDIPLGRPRSVTEVRFHPSFTHLYEALWKDLKDEVRISYEKSRHLA